VAAGSDFIFNIAANVPQVDRDSILEGLQIAEDYLNKVGGGAIPANIQSQMVIKVVATGLGDTANGGAPATTSIDQSGIPSLFFDVANPQWNQDSAWRGWPTEIDNEKTVIHEYGHAWQGWLGALQRTGMFWLNEGIAEFIAYSALVDAGKIVQADADIFEFNSAVVSHETDDPLADYANSSIWPGHVGYVAISWLVDESPNGFQSLVVLGNQLAAGASIETAFRTAFDVDLDSFYAQFEAWRAEIVADPDAAYAHRPDLINISDILALDNVIDAGSGDQTHDGGPGLDTVVFHGARADYAVQLVGPGDLTVADSHSNRDGTDTLLNIERLEFTDGRLAFDLDGTNGAGAAYRIYQAAFDRVPDVGGLTFWVEKADGGMSTIEMSARFIDSDEFRHLYGSSTLPAETFVEQLYHNVLHRASDQGGHDYWVGQINAGMSEAEVLARFADSPENRADVVGVIANGIWINQVGDYS
jgi:hypothetical protein